MATRDLTMIEPDDATARKVSRPVITRPQRIRPPVENAARAIAQGKRVDGAPIELTDLTKIEPDDATAPVKKYAKGGYVRSADGIAKRGKTKGRIL